MCSLNIPHLHKAFGIHQVPLLTPYSTINLGQREKNLRSVYCKNNVNNFVLQEVSKMQTYPPHPPFTKKPQLYNEVSFTLEGCLSSVQCRQREEVVLAPETRVTWWRCVLLSPSQRWAVKSKFCNFPFARQFSEGRPVSGSSRTQAGVCFGFY